MNNNEFTIKIGKTDYLVVVKSNQKKGDDLPEIFRDIVRKDEAINN